MFFSECTVQKTRQPSSRTGSAPSASSTEDQTPLALRQSEAEPTTIFAGEEAAAPDN